MNGRTYIQYMGLPGVIVFYNPTYRGYNFTPLKTGDAILVVNRIDGLEGCWISPVFLGRNDSVRV